MAEFLLDSDCFLQAAKVHYPLDVATGFWLKLAELADAGAICSIDRVKNELYTNKDELTEWMDKHLPSDFWLLSGTAIVPYGQLMVWAQNNPVNFKPTALTEFARAANADPWLAAVATQQSSTVVTHELSRPDARSRVMLPDACIHLGTNYCNTIEMFRSLKVTF